MKICKCGRTGTCETSDGVVRCFHCCEDHAACEFIHCGCEWCGEEDSETANGCSLCFKCAKRMQSGNPELIYANGCPDPHRVRAFHYDASHVWPRVVSLGVDGFDGGDSVVLRPAEARRLATLLLVLADLAEEPQ